MEFHYQGHYKRQLDVQGEKLCVFMNILNFNFSNALTICCQDNLHERLIRDFRRWIDHLEDIIWIIVVAKEKETIWQMINAVLGDLRANESINFINWIFLIIIDPIKKSLEIYVVGFVRKWRKILIKNNSTLKGPKTINQTHPFDYLPIFIRVADCYLINIDSVVHFMHVKSSSLYSIFQKVSETFPRDVAPAELLRMSSKFHCVSKKWGFCEKIREN